MTHDQIEAMAREVALSVFGLVSCAGDKAVPDGAQTLVLLGPGEPGFWDHVTSTPEFADGAADPLDRWSTRVVKALSDRLGGTAIFPFGGPPYAPFQRWATDSGRAWPSPVGLLVHDTAGLWVSYRGAIALPFGVATPTQPAKPCDTCTAKPCLTACPVGALTGDGYDLPRCHAHLDGAGSATCMAQGCQVRAACPAGASYGRVDAQSAFHMAQFHR
ncbi:MAG: ferredoxin [Pseudomonadota bacterium]